ncbi:uncharacterized protein N7477_002670 [Penicillium maclennaniae]|uniref:uncharacterized protein n=1 Tax=Penicillium maclennaniae TaxID=1343394 RepID=UPI00254218A9|nr:uncharacterized protein N7477_002670 [Penicillium maclennaniae]KAJ5677037.1 hypothetical protein N7477_002670 [Penicillium maclennaniae]
MFSATATLDRLKNRDNGLITIYHQIWAVRLLNERLNQEIPILDYGSDIRPGYSGSSPEGPRQDATLNIEATERWNRTATRPHQTVGNVRANTFIITLSNF